MPVDFARVVATAMASATRVGATCTVTLTRPAPPPHPVTGVSSGSASSQTVTAAQVAPTRLSRRYGEAFARARMVLYMGAQGVSPAPQVGDTCTLSGVVHRVTAVETAMPAGTAISYMVALGGEADRGQ